MVYVVLTRKHSYTFDNFFDWVPRCRRGIEFIFYDDLPPGTDTLRTDPVIFTDLDRLDPAQQREAARFADRLLLSGRQVLNHPGKFVDRYSLLVRLQQAGLNSFRVFHIPEVLLERRLRYPIFLRRNSGHAGNLTALAGDRWELARQVSRQVIRAALGRIPLRDVIAVEFQSVARPEGYSAKYSYQKIGHHLIARHVIFSRSWVVKNPDLYDEAMQAEEDQFLATRPHADIIGAIFELAAIDYGRIDYSIDPESGHIQVWEINTNPSLAPSRGKTVASRQATQRAVLDRVCDAFFNVALTASAYPASASRL